MRENFQRCLKNLFQNFHDSRRLPILPVTGFLNNFRQHYTETMEVFLKSSYFQNIKMKMTFPINKTQGKFLGADFFQKGGVF